MHTPRQTAPEDRDAGTRKAIGRASKQHEAEQYEAGYSARFRDEAFCQGATRSWQAGWSDANRELGSFEEAMQPELPFLGGAETRRRGLPFDVSCSEEWKRSWIEADIAIGLAQRD